MLAKDVEIGGVYVVRWHDGSFTEVLVTREVRYPVKRYTPGLGYAHIGSKSRWGAVNLKTGRTVTIKSAAKFRSRIR